MIAKQTIEILTYPDTLRYRDCSTCKLHLTSLMKFESHKKTPAGISRGSQSSIFSEYYFFCLSWNFW